jgi:hypothetical protein
MKTEGKELAGAQKNLWQAAIKIIEEKLKNKPTRCHLYFIFFLIDSTCFGH